MELKEYIQLIKKYKKLFFIVWLGIIGLALFWYFSRPISYEASMSVEISRQNRQQTDNYQYDQYYRIEADNKFADTVAQWTMDPQVAYSIYSQSGIDFNANSLRTLSKSFRGEKLSANYIKIGFAVAKADEGEKISEAIKTVLDEKVQTLNKDSKDQNWFSLVYGKPIIVQKQYNLVLIIAASVLGGLLAAIFAVLVRHYWEDEK